MRDGKGENQISKLNSKKRLSTIEFIKLKFKGANILLSFQKMIEDVRNKLNLCDTPN